MSLNTHRSLLLAGVSAAAVLNAAPSALAQDAPAASAPRDTIVVTAQRREESIEDVPISITAFTSDDLEVRGVSTIEDLQFSMANVSFTNAFQTISPQISIRGINSNTRNVGFESGLGVYLDGVYTGRSQSNTFEMPDIAQIEVLRGPQGVLFGKNTTGGAVLLRTIVPDETVEAQATIEIGNFDLFRANGYISGPLADGVYGKIAGFVSTRDGTVQNTFTGTALNDIDSQGIRAALRFVPNANLDVTVSADFVRDRRARAFPEALEGGGPFVSTIAPGIRTVALDIDGAESRDLYGIGVTADYEFDNGFTLSSITGWRRTNMFDQFIDNDDSPGPTGPAPGVPLFIAVDGWAEDIRHFSQEVRLTSPVSDRFDYILGAYFFSQEADQDQPVWFEGTGAAGVPAGLRLPARKTATVETDAIAVFGHANLYLTDQWTLSGGLRYTSEDKDVSNWQMTSLGFPGAPFGPHADSLSDTNLSPSVSLLFEPNDTVNLYARISRGYKSGGFNADFVTFDPAAVPASRYTFGPETVTNYEIGGSFILFDGNGSLDVAVFSMDYEGLQVNQFDPGALAFTITNAASAQIQGVEIEFNTAITEQFEVNASIGYLDATFDDFRDGGGPGVDYSGNHLQDAPEWTYALSGQFTQPTDIGEFFAFAEIAHRGERYGVVSNAPLSLSEAIDLVNARVGVTSNDGHWQASIWARNLLDQDYQVFNQAQPFWASFGVSQATATYNDPRTFGVTLRYTR